MCTVTEVYGLQAKLQFYDSLKGTHEEMRMTRQGAKFQTINYNDSIPIIWNSICDLKSGMNTEKSVTHLKF